MSVLHISGHQRIYQLNTYYSAYHFIVGFPPDSCYLLCPLLQIAMVVVTSILILTCGILIYRKRASRTKETMFAGRADDQVHIKSLRNKVKIDRLSRRNTVTSHCICIPPFETIFRILILLLSPAALVVIACVEEAAGARPARGPSGQSALTKASKIGINANNSNNRCNQQTLQQLRSE